MNKQEFKSAVMKREKNFLQNWLWSRYPSWKSKAVKEAAIALGISKSGIEFDSMDGEPVDLLF